MEVGYYCGRRIEKIRYNPAANWYELELEGGERATMTEYDMDHDYLLKRSKNLLYDMKYRDYNYETEDYTRLAKTIINNNLKRNEVALYKPRMSAVEMFQEKKKDDEYWFTSTGWYGFLTGLNMMSTTLLLLSGSFGFAIFTGIMAIICCMVYLRKKVIQVNKKENISTSPFTETDRSVNGIKGFNKMPEVFQTDIKEILDIIKEIKSKSTQKSITDYVENISKKDIPNLIDSYLKIPTNIRDNDKFSTSRQSANTMLETSLTILEENLLTLRDDVYSDDVDDLEIQMRFMQYKYGSPELVGE